MAEQRGNVVHVPIPKMTSTEAVEFATEMAFKQLTDSAKLVGLSPAPTMGLMYLPTQAVTEQFREAARAVLADLGVQVTE